MRPRRQFALGNGGIALGNLALCAGFVLDQSLLGPFTLIAAFGTVLAALGSAVTAYIAWTDPSQFEFEGQWAARAPTFAAAGGVATVVVGVTMIALAVV